MKTLTTLIFSCVACIPLLQAEMIETSHFYEIPAHVTEGTLVVLDIDDTLLIHKQMLGCDEWFLHRIKTHQHLGLSQADAVEKAIHEYEMIHYLTEMEIVEPGTESIIEMMQKKRHIVMGLTTRGAAIASRTVKQLEQNSIDLSKTSPAQKDHYFPIGGRGVLYRKGVLFTAGTHKGEAFFQFCAAIGIRPERILFVNDKATHLAQLEESAKNHGIPFLGMRYAFSDARKAEFNPEIADCQFRNSTLQLLLSDEEAKLILYHSQK